MVDVLLGLQWGDEGKGKIIDILAPSYDVIARFQGGPNAGHTIEWDGKKHVLHLLPSGVLHEKVLNYIGPGTVINPILLIKEIQELEEKFGISLEERLFISAQAALITPGHILLDEFFEKQKGPNKIDSTKRGIGPCYRDDVSRDGLRVGDIKYPSFWGRLESLNQKHLKEVGVSENSEQPIPFLIEKEIESWFAAAQKLLNYQIVEKSFEFLKGKKVLAEGAQGTLLDVKFGTYPFVTSSNTTAGGVCTGLGIPPSMIGKVIGVFKAYTTRVGNGPFPTELENEIGEKLRKEGNEFGSTTGRPRRCGWLDLIALESSCNINGVTHLAMMKADVLDLFEEIQIATGYSEGRPLYQKIPGWKEQTRWMRKDFSLPQNFIRYMRYIEEYLGIHINIVSVGPCRDEWIETKFGLLEKK